ncbi:MAG: hypothetical protein HRF40_02785 [Nitrososphaera sp.]|jgi:hypothetical protein
MPLKLSTVVAKIPSIPNQKNAVLLKEFLKYLEEVGASERHRGNELLTMVYFSIHLGQNKTLTRVRKKEAI